MSKTLVQHIIKYTHAITRELPKSFAERAIRMDASQQITLSRAVQQMTAYREALKRCGLKVITLPADEQHPDCVFVEDVAVVIGHKACLTYPGHPSRGKEGEVMRECLQTLGFEIRELDDPLARLDGGDVLFTGQEIFVGQSTRSNKKGADSLQRAFPEFPVTSIPVEDTLHLKSVATLAQEGVIVVGGSKAAQNVLKVLQSEAKGQYQILQMEEDKSANVLFINGQAVIRAERELGNDFKKLTSALTVPWIDTELEELYKADGCLTCCSILVQAP